MSKKIITEVTNNDVNPETGELEPKRRYQVAVLSTEDKYYKFYHEGLIYISDMPLEYHRVLYALLDIMTYVDQKVEGLGEYGMHIFLNVDIKRAIAQSLGKKNYRSIDNVIQELVKGNVLTRVAKGIYRPNPYIVGRGAWKDILNLRIEYGAPFAKDDTFKSVCKQKEKSKEQQKDMAELQAEHAKHQSEPPAVEAESTQEQTPEAAE